MSQFVMLDLLPPHVIPTRVELSSEFLIASTNARYEIVQNFENTGRYGVVVRADEYWVNNLEYEKVTNSIATIYAVTDNNIENGASYLNKVYLSGTGGDYWSERHYYWPPYHVFDHTTYGIEAEAGFVVQIAKILRGFEYIKNSRSDEWNPRYADIRSGESFTYKMVIQNPTMTENRKLEMINYLPYNGDLRIVKNEEDIYVPRGTDVTAPNPDGGVFEDRAIMTGPVRMSPQDEAEFDVFYTTASPETFRGKSPEDFAENAVLWKSASDITDWSKVTAFRIISKSNMILRPSSERSFYVDMKAPENPAFRFDGKKVFNSFAHRTGRNTEFVEGNNVEASLFSERARLIVEKKSYDKTATEQYKPLMGAKFRLWVIGVEGEENLQDLTEIGGYKVLRDPITVGEGDDAYSIFVSGGNGFLDFSNLRPDKNYLLEEVEAPKGYIIRNQYTFISKEDLNNEDSNRVFTVSVINDTEIPEKPPVPEDGTIEFRKISKDARALENTVFNIKSHPSAPKQVNQNAISGEGGVVRFEHIPFADEAHPYTIEEIQPVGTLNKVERFTVVFKKPESGGSTVLKLPNVINDKGNIRLYKLGILNTNEASKPLHELGLNSGERISDVRFQLEDVSGRVLDTQTTNKQGELEFKNLDVLTDYYIREMNVPDGYQGYTNPETNNRVKVRMDYKGSLIIGDHVSRNPFVIFPNLTKNPKNLIEIWKKDDDGKVLSGAEFGLFEVSPVTGEVSAEPVRRTVTNQHGYASFENFGIENGKLVSKIYEVRELKAPINHAPSFRPFRIPTAENEYTYHSFDVVNPKITLTVHKSEEGTAGTPVAGAEFSLYEGENDTGMFLEKAVSDSEGIVNFTYAQFDAEKTYYVKETKIPDGYEGQSDSIIDLPGFKNQPDFKGKVNLFFTNRKKKGQIIVTKLDKGSLSSIEGVQFTLSDTTTGIGKEADRVLTTDSYGVVRFDGLTIGKAYRLVETKTANGYILNATASAGEEIQITSDTPVRKTYLNTREPGTIWLHKTDSLGKKMKNVVFTLEKRSFNVYYSEPRTFRTDDNGSLKIDGLEAGTSYRLRETDVSNATVVDGLTSEDGYQLNPTVWYLDVIPDSDSSKPPKIKVTVNGEESYPSKIVVSNDRVEPRKVRVDVEKTFEGGAYFKKPDSIRVILYRRIPGESREEVARKVLTRDFTASDYVLRASFEDLPYDIYGKQPYIYTVEEEVPYGYVPTVTPDTGNATNRFYKKFHIKNTYDIPYTDIEAKKIWSDSDTFQGVRPTIWFKLYRKTDRDNFPMPVDGKEIVKLESGTTVARWKHLPVADGDGRMYTYTVKEVNEEGADYTPHGYTKVEDGLTVTNYPAVPNKVPVTAYKHWVNGSTERPVIWFALLRKLNKPNESFARVPGAAIKKLENGTTHVTWTGMDETDQYGVSYVYGVEEVNERGERFVPNTYKVSGENTLHVTNTYDVPKKNVTAYKTWVGGPSTHPDIWFRLLRGTVAGSYEAIPGVEIKRLTSGMESVTWENLDATDLSGKPYLFSVVELDSQGRSAAPANYEKKESGLRVTNTYVPSKDAIATAYKIWKGGDESLRPSIWFKLYRKTAQMASPEAVPVEEAPVKELPNGITSVMWTGLTKTDANGNEYVFSVKEVNENGEDKAPPFYEKEENGLIVTNTYVVPKDAEAEATKIWEKGPDSKPDIYFKLYRKTNVMPYPEEVPVTEAPVKLLKNDTTRVRWTNLSRTDEAGRVYTFSVKEVDAEGNDTAPENYRKIEDGLRVTNVYEGRKLTSVKAKKVWVNGSPDREIIWFALYRSVEGGSPELVSDAPRKILYPGVTEVEWKNLDALNDKGKEYTYSVREVDGTGRDFTPQNYQKTEEGLTVTNTYEIPKTAVAEAEKIWVGGKGPRPTVWFKLYRESDSTALEEVPKAAIKELANGTTRVRWADLEKTNLKGEEYRFSVKEVNAEGEDFTPENYTKSERGLTVTNTYDKPKDASVTANKVWSDGPSNRPTIWFKLYRRSSNTPLEAVPGAEIKELGNGVTSVKWTGLERTDLSGEEYVFSVKEVNASGADFTPENYVKKEEGLTVTNTYTSPKDAEATATKTWVNGPSQHPTIWFKLYRSSDGKTVEAVPNATIKMLPNGVESVRWMNLERTDSSGREYTFSVKETNSEGEDFTPKRYTKEEKGLSVTNTFEKEKIRITATKRWVHGSDSRPDIYFRLFRMSAVEAEQPVPDAEIKLLNNGKTSVFWENLDKTDDTGEVYTYFVRETDKDGNDFTPENYVKTENGLVVENYYVPGDSSVAVVAKKTWVGGSLKRPTIWFKLYRQSKTTPREAVPGAKIKELVSGITSVSWTALKKSDLFGNDFTFSVEETDATGRSFTPEGYTKVEEGLMVTNTYRIPKDKSVTASKIWEKGKDPRPTIYFKLYRRIHGGPEEAVPDAELKELLPGVLSVTWTGLERTDASGREYTFHVHETDASGRDSTPAGYVKAENGLTVTNTYTTPKDAVAEGRKIWVGGKGERPVIWLKLYRSSENTAPEAVPNAEIKELRDGTLKVNWTGLEKTDAQGSPYIFSVKEVNANGEDYTPVHYVKNEDGLTVTNTYESPKTEAEARKIWVGGGVERPLIYFRLYRSIDNGVSKEVVPEAAVKALPTGTTRVRWTNLDKTDPNGNEYTFYVKETDSEGQDFTPTHYQKSEEGLTVTNTYRIPEDAEATAKKIWVGGSVPRPVIYFRLYRTLPGRAAEAVPGAEIKRLGDGITTVTWTGLERTDSYGEIYSFLVRETDQLGKDFTPLNYVKTENGLTVTNTYTPPNTGSAVAVKKWVNGPLARPTVWFKLYRESKSVPKEVVPNAEIKALVHGITSVSWTGLEKTDSNGNEYTFSVQETDIGGNDFTPEGYEKTEDGLTVTNTYRVPKDLSVQAVKIWEKGTAPRPTVWFRLYRRVVGGVEEAVPNTELKELPNGVESVRWTNLDRTDLQGREYIYFVRETNEDGDDYTPPNYVKAENGLTVTNTYTSGKDASAKATKTWIGGPTPRPTVWFKLYRESSHVALEEVPKAEIKELSDGITTVNWTGLEKTDIYGNEYVFSVKEVNEEGEDFTPANYLKVEDGLNVTNTYESPKKPEVIADKVWVNGPAKHPTVWFKLYRKSIHVPEEAVPGEPIKRLDQGVLRVLWSNLDARDSKGAEYTFFVRETDSEGNDYTPAGYEKREEGLKVTNTYRTPTDISVRADKEWIGGPDSKPDIYFKLYRKTENGLEEAVPGFASKLVRFPNTTVSWDGLEKTDDKGNLYSFFVKEVNADGEDYVPEDYVKTENGLKVTNTYRIPNTASAVANKVWVNGPMNRPVIYFKLYRESDSVAKEAVPGAEIKKLVSGITSVSWTGLEKTDNLGKEYVFSVKEVDATGRDFTPENYSKTEEGLTVTNTYEIPKTTDITAVKIWEKGKDPRPVIYFKLYRSVDGLSQEAVPNADLKELKDGITSVSWTGLDKTDLQGREYIFHVHETDAQGIDTTPEDFLM